MNVTKTIYKSIIDQLKESVYYVDTNRRIIYWNKAAEELTGYTSEEVLGKCCADNLLKHIDEDGNELCTTDCPLVNAIRENETKDKKNIYLHHKDGHRVHVSTRVSPIKDDYNKIVGAVELFDDMAMNPHCDLLYELEELKKKRYTSIPSLK